MENHILKQYDYAITASSVVLPEFEKYKKTAAEKGSLLRVIIDFENGRLRLQGNGPFFTGNSDRPAGSRRWENVVIDVDIHPALLIALDDGASDGLCFGLEGRVCHGSRAQPCSGLLFIDAFPDHQALGLRWYITFYLYDDQRADWELRFTLPVYVTTVPGEQN